MSGSQLTRRGFIREAGIVAGAAAALSLEERILMAKTSEGPRRPVPAGTGMPTGKIGKVEISRLICGGNLIGGYAHSRDLVYVSSLFKHYFTDKKILETLEVCEANGINTIVTSVEQPTYSLLNEHWKNGGKIQWIAQLRGQLSDPLKDARIAVDNGAVGAHLQGLVAGRWFRDETGAGIDALRSMAALLKQNGLIAGCSAHDLAVHRACEEKKIDLDYYFKTFHSHRYWSATANEKQHDNMWCCDPAETETFMKTVTKPWIAFKTLAAGAINPTQGFKYALQGGADFMCVGMFDFQVRDDVQIVKGLFARGIKRERPWRA